MPKLKTIFAGKNVDRGPTTRCPDCGYHHDSAAGLCDVCLVGQAGTSSPVRPEPLTAIQSLIERCDDAIYIPDVQFVNGQAHVALPTTPAEAPHSPGELPTEAGEPTAPRPRRDISKGACVICLLPDIADVNIALHAGTSTNALVAQYGHSSSTWSRHRRRCLGLPMLSKEESGRKSHVARPPRPRQCCLCVHPERATIDTQLRAGQTLTSLAAQHGYSDNTYSSHRRVCLGMPRQPGRRPGVIAPLPVSQACAFAGCGQAFRPRRGRQRYCSVSCATRAQKPWQDATEARQAVAVSPVVVIGVSFVTQVAAQVAALEQQIAGEVAEIAARQAQLDLKSEQARHLRAFLLLTEEATP